MDGPTDASPDSAAPQPPHNNEPTEARASPRLRRPTFGISVPRSTSPSEELKGQRPEKLPSPDPNSRRIVVLGKTGTGKSSTCSTIFGEAVFNINHSANSGTSECAAETRYVRGRSITLIDTPGFFDTEKSKKELKAEIAKCITECAPGPHAFLIFLKVEKFTEHEKQVIDKIRKNFHEEAFKHAVVIFTHGDQLDEGEKIEDFVQENKDLRELVKKCGGRCHVIDNKYWNQQDEYRSNQVQVAEILNTIDKIVENRGGCYTNEMLQIVYRMIRKFEKIDVHNFLKSSAGITTGALLGALVGVPTMIVSVVENLKEMPTLSEVGRVVVAAAGAAGGVAGDAIDVGYHEAAKAGTVKEAIENTANAVVGKNRQTFD